MTYGERIKQGREAKGLTQEQLAESLEVSRQAVSKWEMDLSRPARTKLAALSEALEIPIGTWAAIDAELEAAERPKDAARPWKIAAAVLAALCLVLGGTLAAGWLAYANIRMPAEGVQGEAVIPREDAALPEDTAAPEMAFPETLALKGRRDFDFGDVPLGDYERELVPYLDDSAEVLEHALWEDTFPDGLRLALVEAPTHWTEEFCDLYLLYTRPGESWQILFRPAEDLTDPYDSQAKADPFVNVLGRDGFRITLYCPAGEYWSYFYIAQREDGTPCMMETTADMTLEADVDEDGEKEILCYDQYRPGWKITDTVEGEERAFIYELASEDTRDLPGNFSFSPEENGFVVTGFHGVPLYRYVLENHRLVCRPVTDISVRDYPDVAGTRIRFATDDPDGLSDGRDPDEVLSATQYRITHRQQAYLALQELYDLTGLRVDFCYCAANEYGVLFSLLPDGFNQRSFFSADLSENYGGNGSIPQFHIAWRELGNDWSPLSLEEAVRPGQSVPREKVLEWYYDRLDIFRTGEAAQETDGELPEERNLYLENGDLFVGYFQETDWGPALVSLYGPYSGGVVNH